MEPIKLNWPGGEDDFLLRLGELEALDDLTTSYDSQGRPFGGVLDFRYRLSLGQARGSLAYSPVKVREVIACLRLGLIGAGLERGEAERRVKEAFINGDVSALNLLCYTIISHSLQGKDHDPVGEDQAVENPPE